MALTPEGAGELVSRGHEVLVERSAGLGSGHPDEAYLAVGTRVVERDDAWLESELVLKVKEPQPSEYPLLGSGQLLFTFLHLAANPELTDALLRSGATCIAYEAVELDDGRLPLLAPMSEVAGRLAPQMGADALLASRGGRGVLLGGVPGVESARVLILGGGVVGYNAALIACGLGGEVTVVDRSLDRLRQLEGLLDRRARLVAASQGRIEALVASADLVVGAVLMPNARTPRLVTREMVAAMRPGSALVDVAVDQGGCFETSRPTTHSDSLFEVDGVVHYCVANMPAAVPATSTAALTNATLPYVCLLADVGLDGAAERHPALGRAVCVADGGIKHDVIARGYAEHLSAAVAIGVAV